MTPTKTEATPPHWTDAEIEAHRIGMVADFVARRTAEGRGQYREAFRLGYSLGEALFAATNDLLDLGDGTVFAKTPPLANIARYLTGPPTSGGDLKTIAGFEVTERTKVLKSEAADAIARVIATTVDAERLMWMFDAPRRRPTGEERRAALVATACLYASERVRAWRRSAPSKAQEAAVAALLTSVGFHEVERRPISNPTDLDLGTFCKETMVHNDKCDVPVRLLDGRLLLIECKVSNTPVNSRKRLNDVMNKAQKDTTHWGGRFGSLAVIAVAMSGVFSLDDLKRTQAAGVSLLFERDLSALSDFVKTAK